MSYAVTLNIYDLSNGMARQFSRALTGRQIDGVWHTGIVVYGREFYFGGGISYDLPGHTPFGQPTKSKELGVTEIPEEMFMELLRDISDRYTQNTYNVITNNCNNFTDEVAMLLIGEGIPRDIVDLPKQFMNTPLGQQMMPMLMQAQNTLMQQSNPLFAETSNQMPLHVRQPGDDQESSQAQQPMGMPPGLAGMMPPGMGQGNMNEMMQRFAAQMGGAGGQPGNSGNTGMGNTGIGNTGMGAPSMPKLGEVLEIQNQAHLSKIIKDCRGVVIDFWAPWCGPCMNFKPIFESFARQNTNPNIVFCSVETDSRRDVAQANNIRSLPTFKFFLNGAERQTIVGANRANFTKCLDELNNETASKASQHMALEFVEFKPMNRGAILYDDAKQVPTIKKFLQTLVTQSEKELQLDHFSKWLETFDITSIPKPAIDQLVQLAEIAEDKSKIAVFDCLRLLVLQADACAYLISAHWNLIDICVIGYLGCQDIKDKENKIIHNYHLGCLKMLSNIFNTDAGKHAIRDKSKSTQLIEFCTRSMTSVNQRTVLHAALLLFNHIMFYPNESKKDLNQDLQVCFKQIDECLNDKSLTDVDTLISLLLCECRILFKNIDICVWMQDTFQLFFVETHQELAKRVQDQRVRAIIRDVMSMVDLEKK